jgi:hypothetical protein
VPVAPLNAEFNYWLLIVGLVVGGALVWLVVADSSRRDEDVLDAELPAEAAWIADAIEARGERADPAAVERVLRLHRVYLTLPPPDIIPSAGEEGESDAGQAADDEPGGPTRSEGLREPADRPPS